jgi:hypothetical protein
MADPTQSDSASGQDEGQRSAGFWTWTRRILAGALAAGAAALIIASHYNDSFRTCDTKEVPGQAVEKTCDGFSVADLTPVFLLALLLLWPDLSEFEVAGLVRVVRRIDRRQVELERGQERIERQLIQVSQTQNVYVNFERRLDAAAQQTEAEHADVAAPAEDDPELWNEFLAEWRSLEPWSDLATRLEDPSFARPVQTALSEGSDPAEAEGLQPSDKEVLSALPLVDNADYEKLLSWALQARDRLELVRQARALGSSAPPRALSRATLIARGLLAELDEAGLRQQ